MTDNDRAEQEHVLEAQAAETTDAAPFKLAQAKMGALFGTVAGVVTLALSISQDKTLENMAHLVITSALVSWVLGWCAAFLINRYLTVARQRLAEQQDEHEQNGQPANEDVKG